jgi:SAM-dependent methyltransferase
MPGAPVSYRFYGELADWWPLISPPEEYEEEAAFALTLLRRASRPVQEVLELGSGGGHNAFHLKGELDLTLVDLSEAMLDVSRRINPQCAHRQGDMRAVRLGRQFDAVFIHDAVDYMVSEDDLRRVIQTATEHCRPGGVVVVMPDHTREAFQPSTGHGGHDAPDGRGVRYLDWTWDPDPADSWILTAYVFLLRGADGSVAAIDEVHRLGLFGEPEWLELLAAAGLDATAVTEVTSEDRAPRRCFVARRPAP